MTTKMTTGDEVFHSTRGWGIYIKPLPNDRAEVKFKADAEFEFDEVDQCYLRLTQRYEDMINR